MCERGCLCKTQTKRSRSSANKSVHLTHETRKNIPIEFRLQLQRRKEKSGFFNQINAVTDWNLLLRALIESAYNRDFSPTDRPCYDRMVLSRMKLKCRIMHKVQKNRSLTGRERAVNRAISKVRYAVERTFGPMQEWRGM